MATLAEIADEILGVRTRLLQVFKDSGWNADVPMAQTFGGYTAPVTVTFVADYITYTSDRVRALKKADLDKGTLREFLGGLTPQLTGLTFANVANDADAVIGGAMIVMQIINSRLPSEALGPVQLDWEKVEDKSILPKDLNRRLRGVAATLASIEPRAAEIGKKIQDIEAAHAAADQLPEDIETLAEKRAHMEMLVEEAQKLIDRAQKIVGAIEFAKDQADSSVSHVNEAEIKANRLIARSEEALRGSTGVGLANAFETRKDSLIWGGRAWVLGLIAALAAAFVIGADRIAALKDVINSDRPPSTIWVNALLALFGIGGPIWFAWLSTKQIWTNSRLAEDYAFKSAVSKAYEGYRKEAVEIDPALQARLFNSALERLEEAPIRLMDTSSHSSPLQELLSNSTIRKSLENIPGIADKIVALIPSKGGAVVTGSAATAAAVVTALAEQTPETKAIAKDA
jgi:hypothetical protein